MKKTKKPLKKIMILTPKNTAVVTDFISELPLAKNFKITIEEI